MIVALARPDPLIGIVVLGVICWVVFSAWMAVTWPDLKRGAVFFGLMMALIGGVYLVLAASILHLSIQFVQYWWELAEVHPLVGWMPLSTMVLLPYYAVWRYRRREWFEAAGRH